MSAPHSIGLKTCGGERIVNDQWHASLMSYFSNCCDVKYLKSGIADRFGEYGLRPPCDRRSEILRIVRIDESDVDAVSGQSDCKKIICTAVEVSNPPRFHPALARFGIDSVMADIPEEVATAATPSSRSAIRFSNTSTVGFPMRE